LIAAPLHGIIRRDF